MKDEGVELIFVSCDRSKADMISYMKVSGAQIFPNYVSFLTTNFVLSFDTILKLGTY